MLQKIHWIVSLPEAEALENLSHILTHLKSPFNRTDRLVFQRPGVISFLQIPDEIRVVVKGVVNRDDPKLPHSRVEIHPKTPKAILWYLLASAVGFILTLLGLLSQNAWMTIFFLLCTIVPFLLFAFEAWLQKLRIMQNHNDIDKLIPKIDQ